MKRLILAALFAFPAHADPRDTPPEGELVPIGCYVAYDNPYECFVPSVGLALWQDYGKRINVAAYGPAVSSLLNQVVEDRALLWDWIHLAERRHKKMQMLKRVCGKRCDRALRRR